MHEWDVAGRCCAGRGWWCAMALIFTNQKNTISRYFGSMLVYFSSKDNDFFHVPSNIPQIIEATALANHETTWAPYEKWALFFVSWRFSTLKPREGGCKFRGKSPSARAPTTASTWPSNSTVIPNRFGSTSVFAVNGAGHSTLQTPPRRQCHANECGGWCDS